MSRATGRNASRAGSCPEWREVGAPAQRALSCPLRPGCCYRAVVAECALIIRECAPVGGAIIAECAPATGVVVAPSCLAYRAATPNHPNPPQRAYGALPHIFRVHCATPLLFPVFTRRLLSMM